MATVAVARAPASTGAARGFNGSSCKQTSAAFPAFAARKRLQRLQQHGVRAGACAWWPAQCCLLMSAVCVVGYEAARRCRVVRLPPPVAAAALPPISQATTHGCFRIFLPACSRRLFLWGIA